MTSPAPLTFSDPQTRRVWLSDTPTCNVCGCAERRVSVPPGVFVQIECSRRRPECRATWWCIGLHPGTVGATFAALFDFQVAQVFLLKLFPTLAARAEDDLWGFEVVPRDAYTRYLQISVTESEARQRPSPTVTQRILKLLSPITGKAAAL